GKARSEGTVQEAAASDSESERPERRKSQGTLLFEYASAEGVELFHNRSLEPFITMEIQGHRETWPLRARAAKNWLQRLFYEQTAKAISSQGLTDAVGLLEAKAKFDGPEEAAFIRIAEANGGFYIDLANDKWEAIEITSTGWRLIPKPPIKFCRR